MTRSGRMKALSVLFLGWLAAFSPACREKPEESEAALPPLPAVDASAFEPAVREQLEAAREELVANPTSGEANGRLAMLYHAYGWLDQAARCYRRATILDPDDYRWWYCLGRIRADGGRTEEALETLKRATRCKGDYLPTLLILGELSLRRENTEEAKAWFTAASEAAPRSPHALFGLGQVQLAQGDTAEAIRRFEEALEIAPDFGRAHYSLALACRRQGDTTRARRHLERHSESRGDLLPPDPLFDEINALRRDTENLFRTANSRFKKGDYAEALRLYRELQVVNPDFAGARYNIGLSLQYLGRNEEAIPHYREFLGERPGNLDALNNLGLCALNLGRYDDAVSQLRKAIAREPRYYKAHFNLGLTFQQKGEIDAAIEHFRRTLSILPNHAEARFNLGRLLERKGERDESLSQYLEALELRPRDGRIHRALLRMLGSSSPFAASDYRQLAAFLKRERRFESAVQVLRASLESHRDWRDSVALAWMLATCPNEDLRRPHEALSLVEPICREIASEDPTALDTLAAAYAALGRFEDAEATASRALRLAVQRPDSRSGTRLAERIAYRLELYRRRRPFHEK